MFELIYNTEVIDTAETKKEAQYLQGEYNMAFHTNSVKIKKVRT